MAGGDRQNPGFLQVSGRHAIHGDRGSGGGSGPKGIAICQKAAAAGF